jgi:ribosomal protein L37E
MKAWRLGGKVVGDGITDGVGQPLQMAEDTTCAKCGDAYNVKDVWKGACFSCRYSRHLRTGCRLYIRGSDIATEADAKFPTTLGYHESLDGQPINLEDKS